MSDIVERARKHEECVRLEGCENHDLILEMAAEIERLSLSPTQAEEVRREALEEAARICADMAKERHAVYANTDRPDISNRAYAAYDAYLNAATAIRALSPPVKDKP